MFTSQAVFGLHCLHACVDCLLQRPLAANQPERGTIWQSATWLRPAAHLVTAGYASEARATQTTISFILPVVRTDSFARPYCRCWKKASTATITVYWKKPPGQEQRS